jgi:hypothetical protein
MPLQIAPSEKFACFAFQLCGVDAALPAVVQLGPRLWAVTELDLDVEQHWNEWIGSIRMDALRDANFAIYTTMPSSTPEIHDQENVNLVGRLNYLLYGILLLGVPQYQQGFSLDGANRNGEINVRKFSDLKKYEPAFDMRDFRPTQADLRRAATLADRLEQINTGGSNWPRLRRGLKVLFDGTLLPNKDGDRLHQLVRAVEALVKPEILRTRNQFAHRISQTFTVANEETRATLLQIFDLRSYVEHMHPVLDVLAGDEDARIVTANRRARQIDVLARSSLLRVVESDALLETFRTDTGIDAFWQMPDVNRVALWGPRLNITAVD